MKKTKQVEIQIESLKKACKEFELDNTQESYYISYPDFLEHFKNISEFKKHEPNNTAFCGTSSIIRCIFVAIFELITNLR